MCELLALSSTVPVDVAFSFAELARHGGDTGRSADGWGVSYFEGDDAVVIREPRAAARSPWAKCLVDNPFRSSCVIAHVRRATQGEISLRNTQPFQRELQRRVHVFAHNGNLHGAEGLLSATDRFKPIGNTDSEIAFCVFINRLAAELPATGLPAFDVTWRRFVEFSADMARLGPANMIYADGTHVYAYADRRLQRSGEVEPPGLVMVERVCAPELSPTTAAGVSVTGDAASVVIVASVPLSSENWRSLPRGTVLAISSGRIMREETLNK